MATDIPSILHHVSVGTDDLERSCRFYDSVMQPLGANRMMSFPFAVAYGKQFPEFWVGKPLDEGRAAAGNGTHVCFIAPAREAVDAFHAAGLEAGRERRGSPGAPSLLRSRVLRMLSARPGREQGRGGNCPGRFLTNSCKCDPARGLRGADADSSQPYWAHRPPTGACRSGRPSSLRQELPPPARRRRASFPR